MMLGPNTKIGALVLAVCCVLLLVNCLGCSAKKSRPANKPDEPSGSVDWTDLSPKPGKPSGRVAGKKSQPSKASKKAPRSNNIFVADPRANKWFKNDEGKVERLSPTFLSDAKSALEHGEVMLKKRRPVLVDFVKKMEKDLTKAMREGPRKGGKTSDSQRNFVAFLDFARQALCLVESAMGFSFPFKRVPEWKKKCCRYPALRLVAPKTCDSSDESDETDEPTDRPRKPRRTTKKPKTKKPKTTTPEPEEGATSEPDSGDTTTEASDTTTPEPDTDGASTSSSRESKKTKSKGAAKKKGASSAKPKTAIKKAKKASKKSDSDDY